MWFLERRRDRRCYSPLVFAPTFRCADDVHRMTAELKKLEMRVSDCNLTQSMLEEQVLRLQRQNNELTWQLDFVKDSKRVLEERSDLIELRDALLVRMTVLCTLSLL